MARTHGSSDWLLRMIRNNDLHAFLEKGIEGIKVIEDTGVPSTKDLSEKQLETYLKDFKMINDAFNPFKGWWIPNRGHRKNWDYICQATIVGHKGLILLEAKAHKSECNAKEKPNPKLSAATSEKSFKKKQENHDSITKCITEELGALGGTYAGFYQDANRIAYANKAQRELGVPVLMVFLGFIGDKSFRDGWNKSDEWQSDIRKQLRLLNLENLVGVGAPVLNNRPDIRILSEKCDKILQECK